MSLLGWLAVGAIGCLISDAHKKNKEYLEKEKARRNTPCQYTENISEYDFEQIVFQSVKSIKKRKINVTIENAIIFGTVISQSGLSTWSFELDFNDWGKLTGTYRINTSNDDSVIPKRLAEIISQEIQSRLS